jgi:hypothetical protein
MEGRVRELIIKNVCMRTAPPPILGASKLSTSEGTVEHHPAGDVIRAAESVLMPSSSKVDGGIGSDGVKAITAAAC